MIRRLALCLALSLASLSLAAQTKHLVSRIEVRGNVPAAIVVSQSALVAGRSYTDADLDVAVARVRRLPFVFHASHSLDSETLVIDVGAVNKFFGAVDASGNAFEHDETGAAALSGGGRLFVGSHGVASGSVHELVAEHDDASALDLEYAHYGIAGSRLFALGGINYEVEREDGFRPDPSLRFVLGYPLTVRQTLTAAVTSSGFESRRSSPLLVRELRSSSEVRSLDLRWTYDTTDDPFFARRGLLLEAGPTWTREEAHSEALAITFPELRFDVVTFDSDDESRSLGVNARKYWSVARRGAIVTEGGVSFDRTESRDAAPSPVYVPNDFESKTGSVSLGYSQNLFDEIERMHPLRQRIEGGVTYLRSEVDVPSVFFGGTFTTDLTIVNLAYVLRWNFGTVRLGLSYTFDDVTTPAQPQQPLPFFSPMK